VGPIWRKLTQRKNKSRETNFKVRGRLSAPKNSARARAHDAPGRGGKNQTPSVSRKDTGRANMGKNKVWGGARIEP